MSVYLLIIVRILAGAGLLLFGLNKSFNWFSPPYQGEGLELIKAMQTVGKGYIWKMVSIVEIFAGLAFLTNTFVPLMAIILFPVMLNAVLYHVFADFNLPGFIMAALFLMANIAILFSNHSVYREMLMPS